MSTITIYKITCTKAYSIWEQGSSYRLWPWGDDTAYYEGYDDGGKEYVLPDGYSLEETVLGEPAIYDSRDKYCELTTHKGRPAIITRDGYLTLKRRS